eukprot:scaffold29847_cov74-Cyclotella_meneghiniana.AAC.8
MNGLSNLFDSNLLLRVNLKIMNLSFKCYFKQYEIQDIATLRSALREIRLVHTPAVLFRSSR